MPVEVAPSLDHEATAARGDSLDRQREPETVEHEAAGGREVPGRAGECRVAVLINRQVAERIVGRDDEVELPPQGETAHVGRDEPDVRLVPEASLRALEHV